MDESKAIEKAKGFGVTDLEPDEELRGRYKSWKRTQTFDEPKVSNVFTYGKYSGELMVENPDVDYMSWYHSQDNFVDTESKETMEARIIELAPEEFVIYKGELITTELKKTFLNTKNLKRKIKKNGFVDVFVDRNVDGYEKTLWAEGLWFLFDEVKEQYYNGWSYFLPKIDGKGKRIKNKNIRIFIEREATKDEPFDYVVRTIEINKK